jgi:hypothetical protein
LAAQDPCYPCLHATGTITVIIMPELPDGRPYPTQDLLDEVWRYLHRRIILGTRLVVVPPQYLEVHVTALVQARYGAEPARVREDIVRTLKRFFHPLNGGPLGRGWPFGRDVYRSEILQVMDQVKDVDHVLNLVLAGDAGAARCDNLCVPPTTVTVAGKLDIEVNAYEAR